MSAPNLNLPPNEVIVKISSDRDFKNYVEIGRVVSDKSGTMKCTIPLDFVNKDCFIKIITTNYPMEKVVVIKHR